MSKTGKTVCKHFVSRLSVLPRIEKWTVRWGRRLGLSQDQIDNLAIAVTEVAGNAIVHGNKEDPRKMVRIRLSSDPDRIVVAVSDEGTGFDPNRLEDPLDPANLLKETGRGVFIVKHLMDEVRYEFSSEGTTVYLTMKRTPQDREGSPSRGSSEASGKFEVDCSAGENADADS